MKVEIQEQSKKELRGLISDRVYASMSESDARSFERCLSATTLIWCGKLEDEVRWIWGLIPPTLLSFEAYVWLHVIEPAEEHQFMIVRQSQRFLEKALERYPIIIGHCEVGAKQSIRWMKLLGASFGEPDEKAIPFRIVGKTKWAQ